ncbi:MAG: hypothetical protein O3A81_03945, partial [bacterium]|nr:hypothetical protein [bacterium]
MLNRASQSPHSIVSPATHSEKPCVSFPDWPWLNNQINLQRKYWIAVNEAQSKKHAGPMHPWGRWEEVQHSQWNVVMQMVQRF